METNSLLLVVADLSCSMQLVYVLTLVVSVACRVRTDMTVRVRRENVVSIVVK